MAVAVTDEGGRIIASAGDIRRPLFSRSAAKPFQAKVCQDLGAELPPPWLAVACSSHAGDPVHLAIVEEMLADVGLDELALRCLAAAPLGSGARKRPHRSAPLTHNCSGKHTAMLRACVARGWPVADYLEPEHPIQQQIVLEMLRLLGPSTLPVGVDGCGAPVFRCTVESLAISYSALGSDPGYEEVRTAMLRYPALVSGVENTDQQLAVAFGGIAKRGAEGAIGAWLPGRGAIAVKVWDGNESRALPVALNATLEQVGWIPEGVRPIAEEMWHRPVLGRGHPVGTVRPSFSLEMV